MHEGAVIDFVKIAHFPVRSEVIALVIPDFVKLHKNCILKAHVVFTFENNRVTR